MHPIVMAMLADVLQAETLRTSAAKRRARAATETTGRAEPTRSRPAIGRSAAVTALRSGRPAASTPAPCCA